MIQCLNVSNVSQQSGAANITENCAVFDFTVYTIIVGLFCLLGLFGNTVSFIVLCRDNSKSATSFLLQALAVADSLVLLSAVPLYVMTPIYPYTGWIQNYFDAYPMILPYLWPCYLIPYTGTILLTVLVSLNRYFAVCKPFAAKLCSLQQARKQVIYVTLFSLLYNIPRFFEYERVEMCTGYNQSAVIFEVSAFGYNKLYRIIYANILYFIIIHGGPLLSLSFLNYNLIIALKKRQRKRTEMGRNDYQQDITLVLVVVVFVFICCQTPTFVDHILWTVVDKKFRLCGRWHYYYTAVGDMMAIINSSVNFFIYILTSRKFRQLFVETYSCDAEATSRTGLPSSRAANSTLLSYATNQ